MNERPINQTTSEQAAELEKKTKEMSCNVVSAGVIELNKICMPTCM